jgi:hypothetical protein
MTIGKDRCLILKGVNFVTFTSKVCRIYRDFRVQIGCQDVGEATAERVQDVTETD